MRVDIVLWPCILLNLFQTSQTVETEDDAPESQITRTLFPTVGSQLSLMLLPDFSKHPVIIQQEQYGREHRTRPSRDDRHLSRDREVAMVLRIHIDQHGDKSGDGIERYDPIVLA